ncbi:hypothetical protein FSP39_024519 [Pinctada imbricata]|uniref:NADP-dependent oxidoreductase domain-containing protein n=1 Tax=Pinctada imbricata TaxID=66713 RepID=A0AA88YG93_PINIB|nr:hypothetical protein FSP39_024519 [Pinctada imbricata]
MSIPKEFMLKLPSGSTLPAVGLGTYAPKHTENEVFEAVRSAIRNGYRHFDCAAIYRNEQAVGQGIKKVIVEGKVTREDLFITSKLWNTCHRPDLVRTSLKKSLQDLGLKYLDLYLIHWPLGYFEGGEFHPRDETGKVKFSDVDYLDTWKALEDCVDEGLVKNIGLSNFNSQQIQRILDNCRIKPCTNQVEVHPHFSNEKLINFCQQKDIVVTAYAPLGSPGNEDVPTHHCLEEPVVKQIAQQKNKSPAQVILRFLLQRGLAVIPKAITPNRIAEDIQLFDFELTEDNMKDMCSLNKNYRLYREDINTKCSTLLPESYKVFNSATRELQSVQLCYQRATKCTTLLPESYKVFNSATRELQCVQLCYQRATKCSTLLPESYKVFNSATRELQSVQLCYQRATKCSTLLPESYKVYNSATRELQSVQLCYQRATMCSTLLPESYKVFNSATRELQSVQLCYQRATKCSTLLPESYNVFNSATRELQSVQLCYQRATMCSTLLPESYKVFNSATRELQSVQLCYQRATKCSTLLPESYNVFNSATRELQSVQLCYQRAGVCTDISKCDTSDQHVADNESSSVIL